MKVTLLHPFTPKAAGVVEKSVPTYHSQPHVKAMANLAQQKGYSCVMEYFTSKMFRYSTSDAVLKWDFYPVRFTLNGDHKKWKKQVSNACLKQYEKETPDVSIINMSGHSSPFSYELSKVILQKGKKYIAMLGGQHYTDNAWSREYYKNADHILVHTNMQKKTMEEMDMFRNLDIRVFPLGVDCTVFVPGNQSANASDAPKLLYVGRIVEWKRVHLAIKALHALVQNGFPKASLNIIGPTSSENYLTELKELVQKYDLSKNVHFLGHKEHADLPRYFQEADLFTLPSDKETFGMVMIESMACGTPVAGIDCPGGPADVIANNRDGLLASPEDYPTAVLQLFKNEGLLREMQSKAREKVLEKYSIEETTRVLFASVNSALSPK
ncbi:glycosyltransferase family 4 protein [Flavobacterium humi]|uniref:Glycosyltransferase family 1 protein n=1 Tax=Flavobacterium humi TaxID=2562683 RepID=A0A4Z0L7M8_9FLAO|nr:glycosyltransferase family 4 protein [Flavobacterium humi]TGD57156.1 glycosyltransferase family 1 protein [Flavobacterium humi]